MVIQHVDKYNEKPLKLLFNLTNKFEIEKISISLQWQHSKKNVKNICSKIYNFIRNLKTQNTISNDVSCFNIPSTINMFDFRREI